MPVTVKHSIRRMVADDVAFKLTMLQEHLEVFEAHALRLLEHTTLGAILWANIGRKLVTFKTLSSGLKHRRPRIEKGDRRP